jgi:steroid delta-isomerase-like uncharacterized protein
MRLVFLLIIIFEFSCAPQKRSPTAGRKLVDIYFNEVWNKGRVGMLDSILTEDYVNHTPSVPAAPGPGGLKPIVLAIRRAFPDLKFSIEDVVYTDSAIAVRTIMSGTHLDTLFGIPPTGKFIKVNQINIEKLRGEKISEHWRVTEELLMLRQMGLVHLTP